MKNEAVKKADEFSNEHRKKKAWQKIVTVLAAVVVFCTTYALILPAITLESGVYCGKAEHTHGEECYENQLACGLVEGEGHSHTEECYKTEKVLVCGQEESEGHSHTEECYDADGVLICGQEESEGHQHTEDCYEMMPVLSCGLEETAGHVHSEECYESVLVCQIEEHTHTLACYSDPDADVETSGDWEKAFENMELTGIWADDLLTVAQTQLGYTESTKNYQVDEGGETVRGYTRYGAWYGEEYAYADWDAMFVSFCLNYAGISKEAIPGEADVPAWIEKLSGREEGYEDYSLYVDAGDYVPKPGDLAFFDTDEDGAADHVGIVEEYTEASDQDSGEMKTIEGDAENAVRYVTYAPDDKRIVGYAPLPENPEAGIMALDGETDSYITVSREKCKSVDSFYLWLQLIKADNTVTKVYGNSEFDKEGDATTGGTTGIRDALSYTDDSNQTYYLIPVSYLVKYYGGYGYTFDPETVDSCPLKYAPDANAPGSRVDASYVHVTGSTTEEGEGGDTTEPSEEENNISSWYVRVQDTGSYDPHRSNIYYTYDGTFKLIYNEYSVSFYVVDHDGNIIPVSHENIAAEDATKYVMGTASEQTENESGKVVEIELPVIDGYSYSGAELVESSSSKSIASVATTGYVNCSGGLFNTFQFYTTEPMVSDGWYSRPDSGNQGPNFNVYLTYYKTAPSVSPSGTVINLFDYWVTKNYADDVKESNLPGDYYTSGINADHALKFKPVGLGGANAWTGNAGVYSGIVGNMLGEDGYPVLSGKEIFQKTADGLLTSSTESLAYLFDPATENAYRNAYRNVTGLIQVDENGYYYYDSAQNYAEYKAATNSFTLYDDWAVSYNNKNKGQFFPFDSYSTVSQSTSANSANLNHYFGMTLTTRFVQQYKGHTDANEKTAMVFDFSGDDDVWIFIDDVLVADLGGIHDAASVDINFATGAVIINADDAATRSETTIKEMFEKAGKYEEDTSLWSGDTFADGTYHTLKFYYLERGSFASNLRLKYNLSSYPPTSIYKVNQYGETVAGATFAVYAADSNYNILDKLGGSPVTLTEDGYTYDSRGNIASTTQRDSGGNSQVLAQALYIGTTDSGGEMVFVDEDGMPYTLNELRAMFGEYFVLKEIAVPEGYRLVSDTINLHIYNNKVLLCENTYTSGVYADASLQVTAPNTLKEVNGDTVDYITTDTANNTTVKGTLFAVVLKYIGPDVGNAFSENLAKRENWAPVYGTDEKGFTIVDVESEYEGNFVTAAIETAKLYVESQNVFTMSSGGQMHAQINGMPGDITTYYYMLGDDKSKTQYTVAYYYSTADSLKEATSENTIRIDADASNYQLVRSFGATIQVPNLLNRLLVQKLDSEGDLVNGAVFALYEVEEHTAAGSGTEGDGADSDGGGEAASDTIYYVGYTANGIKKLIHLFPDDGKHEGDDSAGDNEGAAYVKAAPDNIGIYKVDPENGNITVNINNTEYSIKAAAVDRTAYQAGENGTADFTNMTNGYYYLREIAAPSGYILNTSEVMVLVDDTAVYANAGTKDDGVTVARGPGYVVSTLDQLASQGAIDNTLSWVYERMLVSNESTSFAEVYNALKEDCRWSYLKSYTGSGYSANTETTENANDALTTYLIYNKGGDNTLFNYTVNKGKYANGDTNGVTRRLYTSVGWSYYLLYQDYEYGKSHVTEGANYADLQGQEISNLFSRSTFVQVADKNKTGALEISKTVTGLDSADGETDSPEFTFSVELKDSGGRALTGDFGYTVYKIDDENDEEKRTLLESGSISYDVDTGTWSVAKSQYDGDAGGGDAAASGYVTVEEGVIHVGLTDGQLIKIENIPYATRYTVTETQNTRYSTSAVRDAEKEPVTGIANTGKAAFNGNKVTGTLYWVVGENGKLDSTSTVDYTNTYLKDLLIWKEDGGDANTTLAGAEFTLTKTEDSVTKYFTGEGWSETSSNITTNEYGYIQLDISKLSNEVYTLTEVKAPDGYYLLNDPITFTVKDGKLSLSGTDEDEGNADDTSDTTDTDNTTVMDSSGTVKIAEISSDGQSFVVYNTSGYELPETGGTGTTIYTIGGLLLMVGAVGYGYKLRRRRERRAKG